MCSSNTRASLTCGGRAAACSAPRRCRGVFTGHMETGLVGICVRERFVYAFYTESDTTQKVVRFRNLEDVGVEMTTIISNLPVRRVPSTTAAAWRSARDGKLYVSVGDNGRNPQEAQNLGSLCGKILRYNEDGTLPPDNPFPGGAVYALGFRNVFRFAFQPGTGRLYAADNGPDPRRRAKPGRARQELRLAKGAGRGAQSRLRRSAPHMASLLPRRRASSSTPARSIRVLAGDLLIGAFVNGAMFSHRHRRPGSAMKGLLLNRSYGVTDLVQGADGWLYYTVYSGEVCPAEGGFPVIKST